MSDLSPQHPVLQVQNLSKTYPCASKDQSQSGTITAVDQISFNVNPGEVFAIVGPSGCGKTTALRTIMGFEHADQGRVLKGPCLCTDTQNKIHLPPEKRGIGIVFQDYALFPHLNVIQNVMFGLKNKSRKQRKKIAQQALDRVGLIHMQTRRVQALSGGQQQRVAIARALAPGADILLLDEPFSNLDPELRRAMRLEIRQLANQTNLGLVLVTHDQEEALSTADQIAVMREGHFCQVGAPQAIYNKPNSAFVASFLGQTNLIEGQACGHEAQTPLGPIRLDQDHQGPVLLSIRPENFTLKPIAPTTNQKPSQTTTTTATAATTTTTTTATNTTTITAITAASATDISTNRTQNGSASLHEGSVVIHQPPTHLNNHARIIHREFKGHDLTYRVRTESREYEVLTHVESNLQIDEMFELIPSTPACVVRDDR